MPEADGRSRADQSSLSHCRHLSEECVRCRILNGRDRTADHVPIRPIVRFRTIGFGWSILTCFRESPHNPAMIGRCLTIVVALSSLIASGCAASGRYSPLRPIEQRLIYARGGAPASRQTDEDSAIDARFTADDGVRLHGHFYDHPERRAVVLFCHGNAGSVAEWSEAAKHLRDRHRVAVLVFDYRGYGQSEGTPDEPGILRDARAARRWLSDETVVSEQDIVLIGRSLGGAVAVDLAANDGVRGLVLMSTFSSLPDVAAHHMSWLLPHWNMTQRLNSAEKISRYNGPLLQSHGAADEVVPMESARKLFNAANEPKTLLVIPRAGHNDAFSDALDERLDQFLDSLSGVGRSLSWTGDRAARRAFKTASKSMTS